MEAGHEGWPYAVHTLSIHPYRMVLSKPRVCSYRKNHVLLQELSFGQKAPFMKSILRFIRRFPRLKYRRQLAAIFLTLLILIIFGISRIVSSCSCSSREETKEPTPAPVKDDSITAQARRVDSLFMQPRRAVQVREQPAGRFITDFRSEQIFRESFPDLNDVQLATAQRLGIPAIRDRKEAERRTGELVYIGESPYYAIDRLRHSIPFLIPRAARLLDEIAHSFSDSLLSRGMPLYRPMVTSVLRTEADVKRLRRVNANASENSCHQYGTTFDICYNRFVRVIDPSDSLTRDVWPGELKAILAEVIRDQRNRGACYVKYEYRQSCFHVTAR